MKTIWLLDYEDGNLMARPLYDLGMEGYIPNHPLNSFVDLVSYMDYLTKYTRDWSESRSPYGTLIQSDFRFTKYTMDRLNQLVIDEKAERIKARVLGIVVLILMVIGLWCFIWMFV